MHSIQIELDVPVTMRDGTVLMADVYRPPGEGPFPVLVSRTPYGKEVLRDTMLDFKEMVHAGYVLVQQDVRATHASQGEWIPWKHERQDGYDTIAWAAALPYSNGKVGMFGGSYLGNTQWAAAQVQAPGLAAIAPWITHSDPEDGLLFRGGAIELGLNTWWGIGQAMGQYSRIGLPADEALARTMSAMRAFDDLVPDGYWHLPSAAQRVLLDSGQPDIGVMRAFADRSTLDDPAVVGHHATVEVPSLNAGGWYDVFTQGTLDNHVAMQALGRTSRLIVGPWAHTTVMFTWTGGQVGEVNFGVGAQMPNGQSYTQIQREWYDHWLQGMPATTAHESWVLIFVMGINQWREEPTWPLERAVDTPLYLDSGDVLGWEQPTRDEASSTFVYDPADPVLTRGGNLSMAPEFPAGPFDQRDAEARDDVLVFSTPPLTEDLEITGQVRATLFVSTDGPSTDWVVRLCEVDAAGISRNIVDGITRVHTEASRIDQVEVDLWSTSIVVRAGHRLRAHVTSSCFPRWDRNLNTGVPETEGTEIRVARQRVLHDAAHPSRLVLPVVPD